jgi:hypothetical protein
MYNYCNYNDFAIIVHDLFIYLIARNFLKFEKLTIVCVQNITYI